MQFVTRLHQYWKGFVHSGLKFTEIALRRIKYEESVSEQVEAGDFDSTALVHRAGK